MARACSGETVFITQVPSAPWGMTVVDIRYNMDALGWLGLPVVAVADVPVAVPASAAVARRHRRLRVVLDRANEPASGSKLKRIELADVDDAARCLATACCHADDSAGISWPAGAPTAWRSDISNSFHGQHH